MLIGEKTNYGKLFTERNGYYKKRFVEILKKIGITDVVNTRTPFTSQGLFFQKMTAIILPTISGVTKMSNDIQTIEINKNKVIIFPRYDILDKECERIRYENTTVADYYEKRNLLILYFNPFPFLPRAKYFNSALSLVTKKTKRFKDYDNKKIVEDINLYKNAIKFADNIKETYLKLQNNNINSQRLIDRKSREIIVEYQNIRMSNEMQISLQRMLNNFSEEFKRNLKELEELPFIEKVTVENEGIRVDYGEIEVYYSNKIYKMGKIYILITPTQVKVFKINQKRNEFAHPHVSSSGNPCFGSFAPKISKLVANLQFKRLALLMRQFLTTYNPKSPIQRITYWKSKITKKTTKIKK